jgi:hypothetical protein
MTKKATKKRRPTGATIQKKLEEAGVGTFRTVRHHDGTYTCGFIIHPHIRHVETEQEALDICAALANGAAQVIRELGWQVLKVGNDIDPGYHTLSFSGTTTPMVHFSIGG